MVLLILAAWFLFPRGGTSDYEYAFVTAGDVRTTVTTSGTLRPGRMVAVGAEVSGKILELYADFNDPVARGQRLALIDPSDIEAQIATLEAQRQRVEAARLQAEAERITAAAEYEEAKRDLERTSSLQEKGVVSAQALDPVRTRVARAEAALLRAESSGKIADADIRSAEASLARAHADRARTVIVSPVDGVIINRAVEPGQTLTSGFQTPLLFEIAAAAEALVLEARIDEADIGGIGSGQAVTFTVDAWPEAPFSGVVREVRRSPIVADGITSYPVVIDLSRGEGRLYPGMTALVSIVSKSRTNVIRVPNRALSFNPDSGKSDDDSGSVSVRIVSREEAERLKRASATRDRIRRGGAAAGNVVWKKDPRAPDGLSPVLISPGLRGDDFTEIGESDLKPGDQIAVGFRNGR